MPVIYVADLPEFSPVIAAGRATGCEVTGPHSGYWRIKSSGQIRLRRRELKMGPALWNSALAGGVLGKISRFDRDEIVLSESDRDANSV